MAATRTPSISPRRGSIACRRLRIQRIERAFNPSWSPRKAGLEGQTASVAARDSMSGYRIIETQRFANEAEQQLTGGR